MIDIASPLRLRLDSAALVRNWQWLAARSPGACGAAIKADGYGLGARKVFFVDDNFIGNKAKAKETLRFLAAWQARHGHALRFGTEASLNLADDPNHRVQVD